MALDLRTLIDPRHTALVSSEIQRAVIGDLSALPELAAAAQGGMIPNIDRLAKRARAVGASVIHCTAERRPDGLGANTNARLFAAMAKSANPMYAGSDAAAIVPEIEVAETDLVMPRLHGLSPFHGTELDFVLRNRGVGTLIAVGVSVNVAIQNLCFDAVNAGYQVVIPRDAVAGFPAEYTAMVFANTLGALATLPTSDEVLAAWG